MSTIRITIDLPRDTQTTELHAALRSLGCRLIQARDGSIRALPISRESASDTQSEVTRQCQT